MCVFDQQVKMKCAFMCRECAYEWMDKKGKKI